MKITMINSGLKWLRSILNKLNLPTTKGFRMNISMKLAYQYMTIFLTFSPTSSHLHSLQVDNCGSNLQLVVDEDDNGKLKLERVETLQKCALFIRHDLLSFYFNWMQAVTSFKSVMQF